VAGAWLLWLVKRSWLASAGAFVAGAAIGFVLAQAIARIFYRSSDGQMTVVKIGSASLTSTLPAGLAGGLVAALGVALIVLFAFHAQSQAVSLFSVAIGCGVILGVLFACLSSLI
jgi:hypothetical protein